MSLSELPLEVLFHLIQYLAMPDILALIKTATYYQCLQAYDDYWLQQHIKCFGPRLYKSTPHRSLLWLRRQGTAEQLKICCDYQDDDMWDCIKHTSFDDDSTKYLEKYGTSHMVSAGLSTEEMINTHYRLGIPLPAAVVGHHEWILFSQYVLTDAAGLDDDSLMAYLVPWCDSDHTIPKCIRGIIRGDAVRMFRTLTQIIHVDLYDPFIWQAPRIMAEFCYPGIDLPRLLPAIARPNRSERYTIKAVDMYLPFMSTCYLDGFYDECMYMFKDRRPVLLKVLVKLRRKLPLTDAHCRSYFSRVSLGNNMAQYQTMVLMLEHIVVSNELFYVLLRECTDRYNICNLYLLHILNRKNHSCDIPFMFESTADSLYFKVNGRQLRNGSSWLILRIQNRLELLGPWLCVTLPCDASECHFTVLGMQQAVLQCQQALRQLKIV